MAQAQDPNVHVFWRHWQSWRREHRRQDMDGLTTIWGYTNWKVRYILVYKDPLLTYLLVSVPSNFNLKVHLCKLVSAEKLNWYSVILTTQESRNFNATLRARKIPIAGLNPSIQRVQWFFRLLGSVSLLGSQKPPLLHQNLTNRYTKNDGPWKRYLRLWIWLFCLGYPVSMFKFQCMRLGMRVQTPPSQDAIMAIVSKSAFKLQLYPPVN